MIHSILHNDLYKFSMSNYYIQNFPEASGTFAFHDRDNTEYDDNFVIILKTAFDNLRKLFLNKNDFDWVVKNIQYIPRF
jgi:nicotinate phosphoribosyltransferase